MRTFLFLCTLATAVVSSTLAARAQGEAATAQCTVTEIRASNEKSGVDAKLDVKLKAKLGKPPFTSYDSFKLLAEQTVTVERQKPKSVKRVNGSVTLLLKDKTVVQGGKPRLRLGVELENEKGERTLAPIISADSGDPVGIAGTPYEGGTYVLFLTCVAQ